MATDIVIESTTTADYMKGVKDLLDSGVLNSVPDKYVFPKKNRPLAAEVSQGENIPIIDISALDNGSQQQRLKAIEALGQACAEWGFFRVINHGIEECLMGSMLDVGYQFFSLPSEEKMKYGNRDVLDPVRYGTSFNATADQFFSWRDYLKHFCYPVLHTPENPPSYRAVAEQYFKEIRKLALKLFRGISENLGLQTNYIESVFGEGLQIGIVNLYPGCPEPDLTMGIVPHSDHGGLTILLQDGVGGLQVRHDGHWVAVPPVPNTFVVNVGDHLEIVSNGRFRSVEHRAVVNAERTRMSIAAANGPALDALIFPAPQLIDDNQPAMYRPMLYGEYLRLQQSSELRGKGSLEYAKIMKHQKGRSTN